MSRLSSGLDDRFGGLKKRVFGTIFTKYLLVTSGILIIAFTLFGLLCSGLMTTRWQSESQQQLSENLSGIALRAGRYISPIVRGEPTGDYRFSESATSSMRAAMSMLGSSLNADIFMMDTHGNVFLCSEDDIFYGGIEGGCTHHGLFDSDKAVDMLTSALTSSTGDYRSVGALGSDRTESKIVVGVPIITKDANENDVAVGIVIGSQSAQNVVDFRNDVNNMFLILVVGVSFLSLVAVYIVTLRQVKPLRQMAQAAEKYAAGDFSVRVPVESEDEVGRLAAGFNKMAQSLNAVENSRRSFIANISHELKTPMTTISGFVDGILDGTIPPEKQRQYLSTVSSETKRLSRLVRSMLDLSRIDSGELKLNKTKFDLTKSVFETLLSFEQRIEEKQIEVCGLEDIKPLVVRGDPDLIHQVVYNLLDNAVKFTNEGGRINIRIYHQDRNAYVCIGNTGIGIPSDELPRLFERFYKTDKSRSVDKTGVGLGLYIVKTVLALHDGGIEARSSGSGYCEFEFHIPINGK